MLVARVINTVWVTFAWLCTKHIIWPMFTHAQLLSTWLHAWTETSIIIITYWHVITCIVYTHIILLHKKDQYLILYAQYSYWYTKNSDWYWKIILGELLNKYYCAYVSHVCMIVYQAHTVYVYTCTIAFNMVACMHGLKHQ